jgi:hypothetical protein
MIGVRKLCCMVFADDVNVFLYEVPGTQKLVDKTVEFFLERGLTPNPAKCEFLAISSTRNPQPQVFTVQGVPRETQDSARYLGIIFTKNGKWDLQLQTSLGRARAALGRCKVMMGTIGRFNTRVGLEMFDSIVASVYRYGLGVWGSMLLRFDASMISLLTSSDGCFVFHGLQAEMSSLPPSHGDVASVTVSTWRLCNWRQLQLPETTIGVMLSLV